MWVFKEMLRDFNGGESTAPEGASRIESLENQQLVLYAITGHHADDVPVVRASDHREHRRGEVDGANFETVWVRHCRTQLLLRVLPIF